MATLWSAFSFTLLLLIKYFEHHHGRQKLVSFPRPIHINYIQIENIFSLMENIIYFDRQIRR